MSDFRIIAGPCSVESEQQVYRIAVKLSAIGVTHFRAGAWKPRTDPESFQGMGRAGLRLASAACREHGLKLVSEILDVHDVGFASEFIDIPQIGSRNMHNVPLIREVAHTFPVILIKRGFAATLHELEAATRYALAVNPSAHIIVCERGLRSFEPSLRNQLDLAGALAFKLDHPNVEVIVDPSHATGRRDLVIPMAAAACAAGLDGALIEVHDFPEEALCDGDQAVSVEMIEALQMFVMTHPVWNFGE